MEVEIVNQPYFEKFIRTMCLTLMHSLWQGLIVAILAGAILLFTKKAKPVLRYNLLVVLLVGFMSAACFTFTILMQQEDRPMSVPGLSISNFSTVKLTDSTQVAGSVNTNLVDVIREFCVEHSRLIVACWFLMFAFKSFQAVAGFLYLKKIKSHNIHEPVKNWKTRFACLAEKLRVNRQIRLMESGNVMVPMVIGFFKPIVMVPLGMLANLPASQVEAILLHELAHIRRKDYFVNLIQIFCENVFFFNPALLWISSLIREEREHCCDDLAIEVLQSKTSFVQALVSFQEYNLATSSVTIAFSKKRNHLLDRIKRIINNNNKPLDAMEKLFVTISLVSAAVLSAAVSHVNPEMGKAIVSHKQKQQIVAQAPLKIVLPETITDTLPKKGKQSEISIHSANVYTATEGVSTYNVHMDGKAYDIVQKNGSIIDLNIDGKQIPESEIASHQAEIDKIIQVVKVEHEKAEVERGKADERRKEAEVYRNEADKMRKEAEVHRNEADKMRGEADKRRAEADEMRKSAEAHRVIADKHREEAEQMRKGAEKERQAYEKMQNDLINDLKEAGIITGTTNLSYRLTQDELVVNGQKVSAALHQKIKARYIQDRAVEMVYNYKGRTGYTTTGFIYTK
ncbi:M56 family metallopeptidase [Dyadobacter sp. CY323]|uniref:M56 family metallopeptidase n=1 Tax=Dyadobacter sp. CY323 TaxID=2907302 RepID=UPI001F2DD9B1|nr:M56 family metallopeptidase [Dyadobacter sp. CY323]MCE6987754.1 M48 family metalloprotease [Dyadobacter sp. CY323]